MDAATKRIYKLELETLIVLEGKCKVTKKNIIKTISKKLIIKISTCTIVLRMHIG
jgi:hypothetical protein